ncbi:MAG TPA: hypothetical protein PKE31_08825 [Pseudomonadota bacterium]|jgi:hypothetical protein|nr:hypothetical protein [Pseudomonadota bacterium]
MPAHEEQLRREQELFEKKEEEKQHVEAPAARLHQQGEQLIAESKRVEQTKLLESLRTEAFTPNQLAELPKQTEPNKEAVEQLFHHLVERKDKPPDQAIKKPQKTWAQVDRKTGLRSAEPTQREPDDLFSTGIEGDFVPNTKISAGDFDTHPSPDDGIDWGGGNPRRRRRTRTAKPTKKTPKDGK